MTKTKVGQTCPHGIPCQANQNKSNHWVLEDKNKVSQPQRATWPCKSKKIQNLLIKL